MINKLITDKDRLDWLEQSHFDIIYTTMLIKTRWCIGANDSYFEIEGNTFREAIDNGIKDTESDDK